MDNSGDLSTSGGSGDVNSTATEYWYSHYEEFTIDSSTTNEISTAGQLAYLAYMVNSGNTYSGYVFQLTTDLDMSAYYWVPIGGHDTTCSTASNSYYFAGEFDGNGHTISGLDMSYADTSSSTYNYMGLFGYVQGASSSNYATIHDLGIVDSIINGCEYIGGIVGGSFSYLRIYNCYNSVDVTGSSAVGGVVGYVSSNISNCYNTGGVSGTSSNVGGICGSSLGNVYNSYNVADVSGTSYVGGIAGFCLQIDSCFSIGNITSTSTDESYYNYVGGISGAAQYASSVQYSYYSGAVKGKDTGGSDVTYTTQGVGGTYNVDTERYAVYLSNLSELAKTESWYFKLSQWEVWYASWDFATVWEIDETQNDGYPIFNIRNDEVDYWISDSSYYDTSWQSADGTSTDPYIIADAQDLAGLSYLVYNGSTFSGKYFTQTGNIDLSDHYWMPIGGHCSTGSSTSYCFMGDYDGGGYEISGLKTYYSDYSSMYYVGLFGYAVAATIHDLGLAEDCMIFGFESVGAIVGDGSDLYVYNCYTFGDTVGFDVVGGIVGGSDGSTVSVNIYNCYNAGFVGNCAGYTAGGILGCGDTEITIYNCYNIGEFFYYHNNSQCIGGIVGYAYSLTIMNCYNTADLLDGYSGNSYMGGIVGQIYEGTISKCYNTGNVESSGSYVGGIAGYIYSSSTISECHNTASVGGGSCVAGIVGYAYTSSLISNCYNIGNVEGSGSCVAGIAGYAYYVYNCYNVADVNGSYYVGGVVGSLVNSKCYIYNCFSVGNVYGTYTTNVLYKRVGGVVGFLSSGTISNCYYYGTITGNHGAYTSYGVGNTTEDTAGVTDYFDNLSELAKTEEWFTDSENWNSDYQWDFFLIWKVDASQNDGYPILESHVVYDETNDYWYFEDGYMPQSVYGDGQTEPSDVDASAAIEAYTIRLSTSSWASVLIYSGTDDDYAYVTIYSGSNVEVASAWFVVEPIVWIVAYGEDEPTSVTTAVTASIVTCGYATADVSTTFSWALTSVFGMSTETLESYLDLTYASVGKFSYDSFSGTLSQISVNEDSTTLKSKIAVSSVDEIDALGGTYASTCTDFVAFLLSGGASTDGDSYSADYWTRDLAAEVDSDSTYYSLYTTEYTYSGALNNGVYVTKDGTLSNAKLKNCFGARLTMNV